MKNFNILFVFSVIIFVFLLASCKGNQDPFVPPTNGNNNQNSGTTIPPVFDEFSPDVTISRDGDFIELKARSVPTYRSPYFPQGTANHVPYNGTNPNWMASPFTLTEQNFVFRIPMTGDEALNKEETQALSPIGITVDGIVIYNQFSGPNNEPLSDITNSFDLQNGHTDANGIYHHHIEPIYTTDNKGKDGLIGMMLDGFEIYGPMEDGQIITNSDLDEYHGHVSPNFYHDDGIYHYHITNEAPYFNGGKFFGVPGTVTNQ